jgi:hypothetical protein
MYRITYDMPHQHYARAYRVLATGEQDARERFAFRHPKGILRTIELEPTR